MRFSAILIAIAVLSGTAHAQDSFDAWLAKIDARLEKLAAPKQKTFAQTWEHAVANGKPFVVFAGVPARGIVDGIIWVGNKNLDAKGRASILFLLPGQTQWYRIDPDADVAAEMDRVRKAVTPLAQTFRYAPENCRT